LQIESQVATMTYFVARTIADGIKATVRGEFELCIGGGGRHNRTLVKWIEQLCRPLRTVYPESFGIPSDMKEAMAFALLAWQFLHGRPANVISATGARAYSHRAMDSAPLLRNGGKPMKINCAKLRRIDELLENEVNEGRLPGAVYAIGIGKDVLHQNVVGYAERLHGVVRPMQMDTIFDLASLTKVVSTLPSILLLIDEGHIRLNDPVGLFIPEFSNGAKSSVTVKHLLTHSSGLISHRQYHELCTSRDELLQMVKSESLDVPPNTRVVYSDLGFILLSEIVEAISGKRIDQFAMENVFRPLQMSRTEYCPDESLRPMIAATEEFQDMGVKVGVVHDENTYTMGGVSGHAGLFAPLSDLITYVQMWLEPGSSLLSPAVRNIAVQCHTAHLDGRRGLGWTCRYDAYDHMGDMWPETSVGHTGFTGTSVALDPKSKLWTILLTNDVHYGRENRTIVRLRSRVHNLVAAALTEL
jgi:CubicO group peptidase (beta-lactamase class C family)